MSEIKRVKIDSIIESQIPEFINEEYPLFVQFLKSYYLSLEVQSGTLDLANNINKYKTIEQFNNDDLNSSTILTSNVLSFDSTINVASTKSWPEKYGLLKIDDEIITYTSKTNTSFVGCLRGFSGIDSIESLDNSKFLNFSSSSSSEHISSSTVTNLSNLFLIEFFDKFKSEFLPGFEGRDFNESVSIENVLTSIRSFYSSKGTDKSYKLLFKILYGKDIEIIKPQDFSLIPSSNSYFTTKNILVEKISGNDATNIKGNFLYQNITGVGTASASIYNVEYRPINQKEFYEISLDSTSFTGSFQVSGKTKILETVSVGSNNILVDSTVGFSESGTIIVQPKNSDFIYIQYTDKTVNQFLGVTGVTNELDFGLDVKEEKFAYSYIGTGNTSEVRFRIVNVINDIDTSNTSNMVVGDTIKLSGFGKDLGNKNEFNSWIYNIPTNHNISQINSISLYKYRIILFDYVYFDLQENLYIEDNLGSTFNATVVNINYNGGTNQLSNSIDVQILDSAFDPTFSKKVVKKIYKANHYFNGLNYLNQLSSIPSGVQNTYIDSNEEYFYVTSTGLPNYTIFSTNNQQNISGIGGTSTFTCTNHTFTTGESVYYSPSSNDTSGVSTGLYYVTNLTSNNISLSFSKSDIFSKKYIQISSAGISSATVIKNGYQNKVLKNQKLLKKFNFNKKYTEFDDLNQRTTANKSIGILVNGVEILSPTVFDESVFYGKLSEVKVTDSGDGYDVINRPTISIIDNAGSGAKVFPIVIGDVKKINVISPGIGYAEKPKITISGGNGSGCVLESNFVKSRVSNGFNAQLNVDTINNTIQFLDRISFNNYEEIIYNANENPNIDGLIDGSHYFIGIVNPSTNLVKIYKTNSDAISQTNAISFPFISSGFHYFESLKNKNTITEVYVKNSGQGYSNRAIKVPSVLSADNKTVGINTFDSYFFAINHGFNSGELINYSTTNAPISGLSTATSYYITVIDSNKFKLSSAGIGVSISNQNYLNKNYVSFSSLGIGTHIISYPPIQISVESISIGSTTAIAPVLDPVVLGKITDVYLENSGSTYGCADIINFHRRPDVGISSVTSQAILKPIVLNGSIVDVKIVNKGNGYRQDSDITIEGVGSYAKIIPTVSSDGSLTSINVSNGGVGYASSNTTLSLTNRGAGAKFLANVTNWSINQVVKSSNIISSDDDGVLYPNKNPNLELQFTNFYIPKKLRYKKLDNFTNNNLENSFGTPNHSPILGFAYDGNPIYGPYGYTNSDGTGGVKRMVSSYVINKENDPLIRPQLQQAGYFISDYIYNASGDLDEYNGRFCVTPQYPDGTYAYFYTISVDSNYNSTPAFPYIIGNYFKDVPITENFLPKFNQDLDIFSSQLSRNVSSYYLNSSSSSYDLIDKVSDTSKQEFRVSELQTASAPETFVFSPGENHQINDRLILNRDGTGGSPANIVVSELIGIGITNYSLVSSNIIDVNFITKNSTILAKTNSPHSLIDKQPVLVSGISTITSSILEGIQYISVKNKTVELSNDIPSVSITGVSTFITVKDITGFEVNDFIGISTETLLVTGVSEENSRLYVNRFSNPSPHTRSLENVILLPTKFEFKINEQIKDVTFENTITFFDPKSTVGTGTDGVTRTITGIGTSSTQIRFIPTRSIYVPNHKFFTGQSLIYDCGIGGTSLVVNNVGSGVSFKLQKGQNVYAVNLGKDYVGLSTLGFTTSSGIGTQLNSLEFWNLTEAFGVIGYAHSLVTTNTKITGKVSQSVGIFTTKTNHGLVSNDTIDLQVNTNNTQQIKVIYDSVNRKVLLNQISFNNSNVSASNDQIDISNYLYEIKTGDKVVYISSNPIGGLTNYGVYYVLKISDKAIKLCNNYSDIKISNYINLTSTGGSNQSLYFINPPIKIFQGNIVNFDLSDSSLLNMNLEFFYDNNFAKRIEIIGTVDDGFAIDRGTILPGNTNAYVTIDFSNSHLPTSFYYNLLTKGLVGTEKNQISSDNLVIGANKISTKQNSLNDTYVVTVLDDTTFSIQNNKSLSYDETYNLSSSNFTYSTKSFNAFGGIKRLKVNYAGKGYTKLPYVTSIETVRGKNAVVKVLSNSVGKVKTLERIKDGFDYPTDPTLSPTLATPGIIALKDIRTIDYIGIITGGNRYNSNPALVVKDYPEIQLSCSISGGSVVNVNVDKNVTGLSGPLEILPTRNSNGYEIFNITVNLLTNTCILELVEDKFISSGFGLTAFNFPFAVGDKIFIENCRLTSDSISNNYLNFNSADYDYSYFTVVDISAYNNTVTYDISGINTSTFGTYDSTFNYGTVVNKNDVASFEMILNDDVSYLSKEKVYSTNQKFSAFVMENGWDNNLNLLRVDDSVGILTTGDILVGERSNIKGTIEFLNVFNLNATLGVSRDKIGLLDNSVGILNDFQQRLSDNFYYQKFAYSVKGEIPYDTWRESVRSIIHPSGFKEFSDLIIYSKPSQNQVGSGKSTNMKIDLNANASSTIVNIDNENSMLTRNNFAEVYEDELLPDGSIERVYLYSSIPLLSYVLNKTNKTVVIDDIAGQFTGSSNSSLKGRFLDASNLIDLNKEFIKEEVVAFVEYNYPTIGLSTTYSATTCKRDVGYIVDALSHDIKYNSNDKSVESGLAYWNAGISYVANESEQTLFAYNYVRFLTQYIINNQTPPTLYQTSVAQQFNLNLIQDPLNPDLYRYKDARNLIVANRREILDKSLASVAIGFSDFYFPGDLQTNSRSRYYDAYRLIQQNKTEIIDTSWSNTVGVYTGISTTQSKCKRDLGYFIDAVSTDIFTGGNNYSRQFVLQYFNNGVPISNGLVGEETQSIYAFTQARNLMKLSITNNLTVKDLTISVGPSTYAGGGGNIPNTNTSACTDVQNTISTLVGIVTAVIGAGSTIGLPSVNVGTYTTGGNKCYRDLGYIVDAIAEDVAFGSNQHIIYATKKYFTGAGVALTSGLVGEELQSVYAFKSARDYINQSLTNQLNVKDLTIVPDPITGFNTSPSSCSNVQTNVSNLVGILTTAVLTASLSAIPIESYGTTDCADVRTSISNYVGIITTIIGLGTSYAPIITYPPLSQGGIIVGLSTFKLTNRGISLFKHTFDASSSSKVDVINNKFIIPNHNYQTGQELIYNYENGSPIGIATTSYVTGITSSLINVSNYKGTAIFENGYSVSISTSITGISTTLSPVGPSFKLYPSVNGTNGVGIATFNVLISYSITTGQPISTSIILFNGGSNFAVGDTVSIAGTYLGGTNPTNTLSFKVSSTAPTQIPSQANGSYSNVPESGSGGSIFNISRDSNGFISNVSVVTGGSGYAATSVVSIAGTYVGGSSPTDTIKVSPLELGANILPTRLFVYKLNDNEFKVSGLSTSIFLSLSGLGTGYHSFEYKNPNTNALISIDGIIQSPLYRKSLNVSLASSVSSASTTIINISSGISSLRSNDIINIDGEYLTIKTIGISSTNAVEVDRGSLGTLAGTHIVSASCTVMEGNYNILGDVIYFTTPPFGPDGPVGIETSSSFSGRAFSRQLNASQPLDKNIILDDISLAFTGTASTEFTLFSNGSTTQTLYNGVNSPTEINNNPIILINNILQVPGSDYIIEGSAQNIIKFISGVPKGGKISKVSVNTGFGYQPLIGAAATVTVSAAGTISNITLIGSGFGYGSIPSINVISPIGSGASITAIVGTSGTITGLTIVNPGSGYTTTSVPDVVIGIPTSYSNIGVSYTGASGVGQGAKISVSVGQGSSVIGFYIDDPGTGYKSGDILYAPGITTNPSVGAAFSTFTLTVQEVETDKFSGFYLGQFLIFENISNQFDGGKRKFDLNVNIDGVIQPLGLKTLDGSDLDISNNFIIFVNDILQVPNYAYSIQGTRIVFTEAPKPNSSCTILYYRGSSLDVVLVDPPQLIKVGDEILIEKNITNVYDTDQLGRVIKNLTTADSFKTFPYSSVGINTDNTNIRPLSYKKQTNDKVINGVLYSKERPTLKSTIKPTATLIKPVTPTDIKVYVDNAYPIFTDVDGLGEDLCEIFITENKDIAGAYGLSAVSSASTVYNPIITYPGVGYAYTSSPKIVFSKSYIKKKDPIYNWQYSNGIPTTYQINAISYSNLFVGVGNSSALVTSIDGQNWISSSLGYGSTVNFNAITSVGLGTTSMFVSVGSSAFVTKSTGYSSTISSWSQIPLYEEVILPGLGPIGKNLTSYNGTLTDVAYGNSYNTFVTVGTGGSIFAGMGIGTDYFRSRYSQTLNDLNSVDFSSTQTSGYFVAVGKYGTVLTSSNGLIWDIEQSFTASDLNKVVYVNNKFIIVGNSGLVAISSSKSTYTLLTTNVSVNFTNIDYTDGLYVAITSTGDLYYSFDLSNWIYRSTNQLNLIKDVISLPSLGYDGTYVFIGYGGTCVLSTPVDHQATGTAFVSGGIVTSIVMTDGGFGYDQNSPPPFIIEQDIFKKETIKSIKAKGDFGTIIGVTTFVTGTPGINTTTPKIEFVLKSEYYDNGLGIGYSSLNSFGVLYPQMQVGDYFIIKDSNVAVGHALTGITTTLGGMSNYPNSKVGTAVSFIDGVYKVESVTSGNAVLGIVTVTCNFAPKSSTENYVQVYARGSNNTGINTSGFYGRYSWGVIYDYQNRSLGIPQSFSVYNDGGLSGITTSPKVIRTKGLLSN